MATSYITVYDSTTSKLKRYENTFGEKVAFINDEGILELTILGQFEGLAIKDNKLIVYKSGISAV